MDLRDGRCPESERLGVADWLEKDRVAVRCPGLGAFTDWKAVTSIFWLFVAGSYTARIHTHQFSYQGPARSGIAVSPCRIQGPCIQYL